MQKDIDKRSFLDIEKNELVCVPNHIAIILDGNRRWAKEQGKTANFGHKQGGKNIENICNYCIKYCVKYLTLYCLSVENLKRSKQELQFLFAQMKRYLDAESIEKMHKNGINLTIIGDFSFLSPNLREIIKNVNNNQIKNPKLNLQACICYSGRNEILNCVKNVAENLKNSKLDYNDVEKMTEKELEKYLFTGNFPDVDLMIRTGGDIRISNFLLWKLSYAELFFCKKPFPSFNEEDFLLALYDFQNRKRKYGL